jgi:hypothetical protein
MSEQDTLTPFAKWHAKNKDKLNDKRRKKYAEDSAYREIAKRQSKTHRDSKKVAAPTAPLEYGYTHGQAAEACGVTAAYLRNLRGKEYYPEPLAVGGRLYYKATQVELLKKLVSFFTDKVRRRYSPSGKHALEILVESTYSNW